MFFEIPILSFLSFGVIYPFCFLLSATEPIPNGFHRFHLGLPIVTAGLAIAILFYTKIITVALLCSLFFWLIVFMLLAATVWNKDEVNILSIVALSLGGLFLYSSVHGQILGFSWQSQMAGYISGLCLVSSFYAMNLGHFYLNVHGLKIQHLFNATVFFMITLLIRLFWDIYLLGFSKVFYDGEMMSTIMVLKSFDGILILTAIFFSTLMPLLCTYFAFGTLKLKNTQATTGILYVLLAAVLLGDLASKYFWLRMKLFI